MAKEVLEQVGLKEGVDQPRAEKLVLCFSRLVSRQGRNGRQDAMVDTPALCLKPYTQHLRLSHRRQIVVTLCYKCAYDGPRKVRAAQGHGKRLTG